MDVIAKARESMTAALTGLLFALAVAGLARPASRAAGHPGGAGGGTGQSGKGEGEQQTGQGGGFGLRSAPVGAFVIKDGEVSWRPAVDLNKVILGGQIVGIIALLALRSIVRTLARRREE